MEKNIVLNDFYYTEFLAYYILESKSNKTIEYHHNELDDNLTENNHKECSCKENVKLISGETMSCRKVRRILRYHVPYKLLPSGKSARHVLLLFYLLRDEKELL